MADEAAVTKTAVLAKDIMTPKPFTLKPNDGIKATIQLFMEKRIKSMAVVNHMNEILGIVTEVGMLRAYLQLTLKKEDIETVTLGKYSSDLFEVPNTVDQNTPLPDVIKSMMHAKTNRVLVINANRNLVGIISPRDVFTNFMKDMKP